MAREYLLRVIQHLLGSFIFDAPGLGSFKSMVLRAFFTIGKNTYISYHTVFVVPHGRTNACLKLGNHVAIEHSCFIDYSGGLTVDDHVWISEGVFIGTHGHRITSRRIKKEQQTEFSSLHIGEDAWIGAGSIILDKVQRIGRGAVVGAGSVVTKDVEAWSVVGGNPARVIGRRQAADDRG